MHRKNANEYVQLPGAACCFGSVAVYGVLGPVGGFGGCFSQYLAQAGLPRLSAPAVFGAQARVLVSDVALFSWARLREVFVDEAAGRDMTEESGRLASPWWAQTPPIWLNHCRSLPEIHRLSRRWARLHRTTVRKMISRFGPECFAPFFRK